MSRILIAGIGNIFLGDDAFGCEVAQRLQQLSLPEGVRVVDFGIRGLDLAYALLEQYSAVILVDAVPRGDVPGTVYLIEPDLSSLLNPSAQDQMVEAHSMHPEKVIRLAASMGARFDKLLLVGCEPTPFDPQVDLQMELSPPVAAAVDQAVSMIQSLLVDLPSPVAAQGVAS